MQVTLEFFILFLFVAGAFIFFLSLLGHTESLRLQLSGISKAEVVARTIALAANRVLLAGNGSNTTVFLPSPYNITSAPRAVIVTDEAGKAGSAPVITTRINVTTPANTTQIFVTNANDEVRISG